MGEDLLSLWKNCSSGNREKLSHFIRDLFPPQGTQINSVESQLEIIFTKITRQFSLTKIRQISKNERNKKDLNNYQFSYGQITFKTILNIVERIKKFKVLKENQIFYDLGSGSGKVLFAASLCHSFAKCKGIEYLETLFQASLELKRCIEAESKYIQEKVCDITNQDYKHPQIEILNQNFQKINWSDGTVIFVSSTCYTRQMMFKIQELCQKLSQGTILITLTRSIDNHNNNWKLLQKFQGETSWGPCTVFIHSRGH